MTPFGGWDMPLSYSGQLAEHKAVRENVGMFDVSHMGQVRFRGADTLEFLQHLVPADIAALTERGSKYTQLVTETGGTVDDLIVTKLGAEEYFAVVNASTRVGDVEWMKEMAEALGYEVKIEDESARWGMIAVQGPKALALLDKLVPGGPWSVHPVFTLHPFTYQAKPHLLSRTGYTGEAGAELLCPAELAEAWWKTFLDAGVLPCGLAARDSLRLEAGYCLYGSDMDTTKSPVEAGLGWSIGWAKKENFIGSKVLRAQKANGVARKLIGLRTEGRKPIRHGDIVVLADKAVGEVTSGGYSPILECGIALAYVDIDAAKQPGLAVQTKTNALPATVAKTPFVKTSLKG